VSSLVCNTMYCLRTFARLVLSWATEHGFVASSCQHIEHGPQVDLSPAIVITLNNANALNERQGRGDED
jgi:hypothetical protein